MNKVPSVRATEVPDLRLSFVREWEAGGQFRLHLRQRFLDSANIPAHYADPNADVAGQAVKEADLFWVSPSFLPLLLKAADAIPDDTCFYELAPLPTNGLVVLGAVDKWMPPSIEASAVPDTVAMSWTTEYNGVYLDGSACDGVMANSYGRYDNRWFNARSVSWSSEDPVVTDRRATSNDDEDALFCYQRDRRLLAAFSQLISQPFITDTAEERMPRPVQKRSSRKNLPSTVRVVRLRRPEGAGESTGTTASGVEYSHQWLVSGHWRNQPCGPERKDRRLIWVAPHIKGPSDKPLVLKNTVHALVR